jgi:hypothetical protein
VGGTEGPLIVVVIVARDCHCRRSRWWAIASGCSLAPAFCHAIGVTHRVTRAVVAAWCDTWAVVGGFWAPQVVVGGAFVRPFEVAVRARLGDFRHNTGGGCLGCVVMQMGVGSGQGVAHVSGVRHQESILRAQKHARCFC